jgi:hypothetical protein
MMEVLLHSAQHFKRKADLLRSEAERLAYGPARDAVLNLASCWDELAAATADDVKRNEAAALKGA